MAEGGQASTGEAVQATEGSRAPLDKLSQELRVGRAPPTLVAGFIAWAITVAPAGFARGAGFLPGALAVLSFFSGVAGSILLAIRPRIGRHVGISLFVGFAVATWLSNTAAIHPLRLEPIRGAFGAIAWGVFAVSWSDRWGSKAEPVPPDPEAPALLTRATLAPLAVPLTAVGIAAGVGYLVYAFSVRDPDRALLAQAGAIGCAVAVVSAAGTVATLRGKHRVSNGRRLTPPVVRALLFLVTFALAGAIVAVLR